MKRNNRFIFVAILTIALMLIAGGTWAAPRFQGTVPPIPVTGETTCSEGAVIDMGTAIFTPKAAKCSITVELVTDPAIAYVPAPEGKAFIGDTFKVTADPKDTIVQVCYAYPPEFANKDAKIYRLNEDATPNVWVEIPGAAINNGTICVTSAAGVFSLIGNQ